MVPIFGPVLIRERRLISGFTVAMAFFEELGARRHALNITLIINGSGGLQTYHLETQGGIFLPLDNDEICPLSPPDFYEEKRF